MEGGGEGGGPNSKGGQIGSIAAFLDIFLSSGSLGICCFAFFWEAEKGKTILAKLTMNKSGSEG